MFNGLVSPWHIAIVVLIALLVFGPKRLPEIGRGLGRSMHDFQSAIKGEDKDDPAPTLPAAPAAAAAPAPAPAPVAAAAAPTTPTVAAPAPPTPVE